MASRTISAKISSSKTCKHEDNAAFTSSLSFGAAVNDQSCVGGEITFSAFKGYGSSYYFIIYIDGKEACETREITDDNGDSHELITYIDSSSNINSDVLLRSTGNISVLVISNTGSSSDVCGFASGCEITIKASYGSGEDVGAVTEPSNVKVSKTLSKSAVDLTWKAGSAGTNNPVTGYNVLYTDSADGVTWGTWATASGSPLTGTRLSVSPPAKAGWYRKFRVRTLGSSGVSYHSAYVESSNMLRRDHDALDGFTDPTLTAKVSIVKALYITELQDRVNTLHTFYNLGGYNFTPCTAGVTKIAKWTELVNEIREAIDQICTASGKTHETWIAFDVNCPRVDVIQQLRDVALAL